ncbi:MAG: aldehyde dehydrogenase family protein [Rhizomicrobium sp.]
MHDDLLNSLCVKTSGTVIARSPIDGAEIGHVSYDDAASIETKIAASVVAFREWRNVPAPRRGELVRLFGEELRAHKDALGKLVTLEAGKILQEGLGEVQENDRHLRFRSRSFAPALRPHHRERTPWPSHDGDMAPRVRSR